MTDSRIERLESYCLGLMPEEERVAFDRELKKDATLREDLSLYREMQGALSSNDEDLLVAQIKAAERAYDSRKRLGRLVIAIVGLVCLVALTWWLLQTKKQAVTEQLADPALQSAPVPAPAPKETSPVDTLAQPQASPAPEPKAFEEPVLEDTLVRVPVFAARFERAERLEKELEVQLRSNLDLSLEFPEQGGDVRLPAGTDEAWLIAGLLSAGGLTAEDFQLVLEIYSNQVEEFLKEEPRYRHLLSVKPTEQPERFEVYDVLTFSAEKGLYYVLIRDDYSGATIKGFRILME